MRSFLIHLCKEPMWRKMTNNKIKALLGFAMKSKRLCLGQDSIEKMLDKAQIKAVLVDGELSENSLKKLVSRAESADVRVYRLENGFLSSTLSLNRVLAAGLFKCELADEIIKNIDESMAITKGDIE